MNIWNATARRNMCFICKKSPQVYCTVGQIGRLMYAALSMQVYRLSALRFIVSNCVVYAKKQIPLQVSAFFIFTFYFSI